MRGRATAAAVRYSFFSFFCFKHIINLTPPHIYIPRGIYIYIERERGRWLCLGAVQAVFLLCVVLAASCHMNSYADVQIAVC